MQTFDIFALVAEVATTILGFSGVVVVFQKETLKKFGPRLLNLVFTAVAALLFSLIPLPLLSDSQSSTFAVKICVALLAIFLIAHFIFLIREFLVGRRETHRVNPYLVAPFLVLNLIVAILVSREVFVTSPSWSTYTWGLYFLVIVPVYLFGRMIWLTWRQRYGDGD